MSTDPTGSAVIVPASADFSRDAVEALCCDQLASYKRPGTTWFATSRCPATPMRRSSSGSCGRGWSPSSRSAVR
ncbi:hypothetical protein HBB16_09730 [Pseudonocardia sp. MCCB 268]|nr:hypothetical protein [Pseudonocardia cytotoxica]